ncbi:hypothetical protein ACHHYP_16519 [Achlya hypogyna]|uniref:Secreted protein n=1 Tax=Achlya hypogyna TaxID=1202772 RepID=A0A1V9Y6E3_ACHHY|nr:hypothetical protein ACHHYP_16519 [Achlya hypogyna]
MLRLTIAAATAAATSAALAPFAIPSYDIAALEQDAAPLVASLETYGIVALKGIPAFEDTRFDYLHTAFECIQQHPELPELQHKTLGDGTARQTISTNADGDFPVANACPEYAHAHRAYMDLVQAAAEALGRTLDASSDAESLSLADVAQSGKHLDHVHMYSASPTPATDGTSLSLEMHTDNGLFLLTSAPLFFDEQGNEVSFEAAGLEIEVPVDGTVQRVAPTLRHDELVLMVGEGFNRWGNFGHRFPPVVHGLRMPAAMPSSVARLFSGRMVLMRPDDILVSAGLSFDEYAAATARHLADPDASFAALACPTGRSLLASDLSCTLGVWVPSNASASTTTTEMCMRHCNSPNMQSEVATCKKLQCVKTGDVPHGGTVCWMLCVEHLTSCSPDAQTCLPDQTLECPAQAATATAAPGLWVVVAFVVGGAFVLALVVRIWRRRTVTQRRNSCTPTETSSLLA